MFLSFKSVLITKRDYLTRETLLFKADVNEGWAQACKRTCRLMTRALAPVFLMFSATLSISAATYYVAPNGSSSNNGLSTNSPWALDYAMANAGASNTIMLMDGQYSNGSTVAFTVSSPYQTFKAINKWGPEFYNIGSPDGTGGVIRCLDFNGVGTVLDGLCFSNCQYYPILFHQAGLSNCVVRNCWVLQTGNFGWDSSGYASKSGMQSYAGYNLLVERNLFEWNGTNASPFGFNHGI